MGSGARRIRAAWRETGGDTICIGSMYVQMLYILRSRRKEYSHGHRKRQVKQTDGSQDYR